MTKHALKTAKELLFPLISHKSGQKRKLKSKRELQVLTSLSKLWLHPVFKRLTSDSLLENLSHNQITFVCSFHGGVSGYCLASALLEIFTSKPHKTDLPNTMKGKLILHIWTAERKSHFQPGTAYWSHQWISSSLTFQLQFSRWYHHL